ncbi:Protein GDAP2 homolog [Eumeta japonica]|uniref:Protein GDAP2 homolog n=1 Tax=Eumeta variegata TaxID=151549 RepID=A0A4C1VA30_EUMVA|nr:Protein GDAP2 homolog [Eumeta japonica]
MRAPSSRSTVRVPATSLARWAHSPPAPPTDYSALGEPKHARPPHAHDPAINERFAIWQGDISTLEVDAVTNTTDETLTEVNAVSERILAVAGPGLKEEILTRSKECRTGEVCVTLGHELPCRHIIHTVSPKYVAKYHSAAENALHNCYKNVLYKAQEIGVRTLALCFISTPRRNFPPDVATHVALRTIRRHLEQNKLPQLVVLCSTCGPEIALLAALAPLYFPRGEREAHAARWHLAPEIQAPERRIRIIHNPHTHGHNTDSVRCKLRLSRRRLESRVWKTSLEGVQWENFACIENDGFQLDPEDSGDCCHDEEATEAAVAFARACGAAPDTQRLLARPHRAPSLDTARHRDDHDDSGANTSTPRHQRAACVFAERRTGGAVRKIFIVS